MTRPSNLSERCTARTGRTHRSKTSFHPSNSVGRWQGIGLRCRGCLPNSNTLPPSAIIFTLEVDSDRTIRVDWLLARPGNGPFDTRANFDLDRQLDFATVALGQQEGSLPNAAAVRVSSVQRAVHKEFPVGALQLQPENARDARNSSV